MKIQEIKVENVRGISSCIIRADIHPNKPTFFVAPNGFGKTSLATAFHSLNRNRVELDEDEYFQHKQSLKPRIEIHDDNGNIYIADHKSNTIVNDFSVFVIKNQIKPKSTVRNFGGFRASSTSLVVEPIVIYKTIPARKEFEYSYSAMKSMLGESCGKICKNLGTNLKDYRFVNKLSAIKSELSKLKQVRIASKIESYLYIVNQNSGNSSAIKNMNLDVSDLLSLDVVVIILQELGCIFDGQTDVEKLVNIAQLRLIYCNNENNYSGICSYYRFVEDKTELSDLLALFNCTWKNIQAVKKGSQFVIDFPKANQISNGERDVLCFIGKLFEAKAKLRKNNCILIIDELFDYLDDANLIACQYFLTKLIEDYKEKGKNLFPIILTHLDPLYFNTYSFNTKNVIYLDSPGVLSNKYKINNLLQDREKCRKNNRFVYDSVSTHYLHFSTQNANESAYLSSLNLDECVHKAEDFRQAAEMELEAYCMNKPYDPALVCCGLRIFVEKTAYMQLRPEYQEEYLSCKLTNEKLSYAREHGAILSETFFLLGIIYNEALHLDAQSKKLIPITRKLQNKVIHNMIHEIHNS